VRFALISPLILKTQSILTIAAASLDKPTKQGQAANHQPRLPTRAIRRTAYRNSVAREFVALSDPAARINHPDFADDPGPRHADPAGHAATCCVRAWLFGRDRFSNRRYDHRCGLIEARVHELRSL
jgi:hypothetical protein